jgi:hypothetical protein
VSTVPLVFGLSASVGELAEAVFRRWLSSVLEGTVAVILTTLLPPGAIVPTPREPVHGSLGMQPVPRQDTASARGVGRSSATSTDCASDGPAFDTVSV